MASPVTILVSDSQPLTNARQLLAAPDRIIVVTHDVMLARHALSTMLVAVWVCDLTLPGMDLQSALAIAKCANPALRVVFTGPPMMLRRVSGVVSKNAWAVFVPRPWKVVEFKKAVSDQVREFIHTSAAYLRDSVKRAVPGRSDGVAQPQAGAESSVLGPDPKRYSLIRLIGEGGTGKVFLARDMFLEMDVAIKVVNPELLADSEVLASFKDEARITMQLSHTGILRFYNFNTYHGCYYMVMEVVTGRTLRDVIASEGAFSPEDTVRILYGCADPIDYAHSHNVIHNDLKPENIIITETGGVKIIDFGTATLRNRVHELKNIVGTPEYMSPEQLRGGLVGPQGDVYAMGVITYMMLTACFPFPPGTTVDDFFAGIRPDFQGVPREAADVLEKATAVDPQDRYESVLAFTEAIAAVYGVQLNRYCCG